MDKTDIFETLVLVGLLVVVFTLSFCACSTKTTYKNPTENFDKIIYGHKNTLN